jgi:stearoyl-CoA desaturase (Delta-9 desaturase)
MESDLKHSRTYKILLLIVVVGPLIATLVAIKLLWDRMVHWNEIALLAVFYVLIALGVTVGFHRMLTHRSFETNPIVKAIFLILGSMALEGPALLWAANHVKHHANSDQDDDPHSPVAGFFHAHLGWMFTGTQADPAIYCKGLLKDRVVVFISQTFFLWAALGLLLPFLIGGWRGLLWAGLVRIFLTHHVTWSVNSVCHVFGNRPFATRDRSTNQWLVGLLAMGEGWHNNHHAFPRSAFHGLHWWQFDMSGYVIRLLEKARLVWRVHRVPAEKLRPTFDPLGASPQLVAPGSSRSSR